MLIRGPSRFKIHVRSGPPRSANPGQPQVIARIRRKLAALTFVLECGMPWPVIWRIVRDRVRPPRASAAHRAAQERFANSLGDARIGERWFLRHIPAWLTIFEGRGLVRRSGLRVLEIGSWEGLSSRFILDHLPGSMITCVDTWGGADEHAGGDATLADLEARFDHNLGPYGDRVRKHKGTSQEYFTAHAPRECFDLVYVDGSHRADDVLVDAVRGFEALAVDGVMIFDDYLWKYYARANDNPAAAVNAFLRLKRGLYTLLHAGTQVAIAKTRSSRPTVET